MSRPYTRTVKHDPSYDTRREFREIQPWPKSDFTAYNHDPGDGGKFTFLRPQPTTWCRVSFAWACVEGYLAETE